MITGSKGQIGVRACTESLMTLGPAKHEKVAIYAVNQRISNVCRVSQNYIFLTVATSFTPTGACIICFGEELLFLCFRAPVTDYPNSFLAIASNCLLSSVSS